MAAARTLLAWSGGKDSAWALHVLRANGVEVAGLFTTMREDTGRVAVHAVPRALLHEQIRGVSLPLYELPLPRDPDNALYERVLGEFVAGAKRGGITHLAFGDLFLEEIRRYRERQFAKAGVELLFPLWGLPTRPLAEEMVGSGLRAWLTCVDTTQAPASWAGALFDADFVLGMPDGIDACGENGEFHTFVFEGPMLERPLAVRPGGVSREGRWAYADLVLDPGGR